MALALTACLAMFLAALLERGFRRKSGSLAKSLMATELWPFSVGVVALLAVFPGLPIGAALAGLSQFASAAVLSSVSMQIGLLTLVCAIGWLIPAVAAFCVLSVSADVADRGQKRWAMPLVLAALGMLACEFLAAVASGVDRSLLGAALLGTYVLAAGLWNLAAGHRLEQSDAAAGEFGDREETGPIGGANAKVVVPISSVLQVVLHGLLCGFLLRLLDQLLLPVSWVSAVIIAAIVAGVGVGLALFRDRTQSGRFTRLWRIVQKTDPVVLSLSASVLTVLLFESLVWLASFSSCSVRSVSRSAESSNGPLVLLAGKLNRGNGCRCCLWEAW
jgi:hypothetical protein